MQPVSYARHQFPPEVMRYAVWLYLRFTLSYRDVEELLAERGLEISYETIRRWVIKFGPAFARNLRRLRPRPTETWHLDEMVVSIQGRRMYVWRAVDREGEILDDHVSVCCGEGSSVGERRHVELAHEGSTHGHHVAEASAGRDPLHRHRGIFGQSSGGIEPCDLDELRQSHSSVVPEHASEVPIAYVLPLRESHDRQVGGAIVEHVGLHCWESPRRLRGEVSTNCARPPGRFRNTMSSRATASAASRPRSSSTSANAS
jgi:hypothetical protein